MNSLSSPQPCNQLVANGEAAEVLSTVYCVSGGWLRGGGERDMSGRPWTLSPKAKTLYSDSTKIFIYSYLN